MSITVRARSVHTFPRGSITFWNYEPDSVRPHCNKSLLPAILRNPCHDGVRDAFAIYGTTGWTVVIARLISVRP